ncbi:MAG: cyclopropane-fatty-acyl-phospholipid synthase family protein [Hyphomicrobiaceae bacterium]|nr:cyclopropane-fatty-acyl-phospholipid synthase family protein [Hyphomicrobiaceae bacterium]
MFKPLALLLGKLISHGTLEVLTSDGRRRRFGDGSPPQVAIRLSDRSLEREIALDPNLAVGEAYTTGRLEMLEGRIYDLIELVLENAMRRPMPRWVGAADRLRYLTRRIAQFNPAGRARRNVAHHYDIDGAVYDLFLDGQRQYSCAYFLRPDEDLEEAQRAKIHHIAAKLAITEGQRVLDIGSGWGGLALNLARISGCEVDGITLSSEQLAYARSWAERAGLSNRVRFDLADYRSLDGQYDRIVSVGMFEHVGINHYGAFFDKLAHLLAEDGVALVHFIGRTDGPAATNAFIARHIFPGGYIPALSEVLPAVESSGLMVTDIEVLRLHYALTLRRWRERFLARRDEAARIQGEEFCRMWEFYLAGSEAAFRYQNLVVMQIQLTHRVDTLPIVRDYISATEARFAAGSGEHMVAAE